MDNDVEISFVITEEEKERIQKILFENGGLRHYLVKVTDGTELDAVEYKDYKKIEDKIDKVTSLIERKLKFCKNEANGTSNDKICRLTISFLEEVLSILQGKENK